MPTRRHRIFRCVWWCSNLLLAASVIALVYSGAWEYSLRRYLNGFSDAVVPATASPEQKVEEILTWMRTGPPRINGNVEGLSPRDPQTTLNYQQLLAICGSATNAFLNLARSSGLRARRLLLLAPDRTAKHVVAEVLADGRWVVVDPTYRTILRDAQGRLLTRKELRNPAVFAQATNVIPNYPPNYDYSRFAHVRLARLPLDGFHLRVVLDAIYPNWDEAFDWGLLLERESFFAFFVSAIFCAFFLAARFVFGWYADRRLKIPRFHLREHFLRAGTAFFSTPEMK